jgi:hypothetical protein
MLVDIAATFTERQQLIFQLVLREGISGPALAFLLGITEKAQPTRRRVGSRGDQP